MVTKVPKIPFKAGDDFYLTMTVYNKTNDLAIAAAADLAAAQAAYDDEFNKPDPDPVLLESLNTALGAAKEVYMENIIVDIRTWDVTSSMRWAGKHICDFTVTIENDHKGKFWLEFPAADTQLWKPRVYDIDVQFVIDGKKSSSQTFQLDVKRDITIEEVAP